MVTSAVWSRRLFDSRTSPLRSALIRQAETLIGPNDAENCVQNALVCAWNISDRFNPEDDQTALFRWLSAILRHSCASTARQRAAARETLLPPEAVLLLAESDEYPDLSAELWADLSAELYRRMGTVALTPDQKHCLQRWLSGETHREIANNLGKDRATVTHCIQRAVKRLQEGTDIPQSFWVLFWQLSKVTVYHKPSGVWKWQSEQSKGKRAQQAADKKLLNEGRPRLSIEQRPVVRRAA